MLSVLKSCKGFHNIRSYLQLSSSSSSQLQSKFAICKTHKNYSTGPGATVAAMKERREGDGDLAPIRSIKTVLNSCKADDHVRVRGWVKSFRKQKKFTFADIYDGLSFHQLPVVIPTERKPEELNMHTSVDITGVLVKNPKHPEILELHPTSDVKVLGSCDQIQYPLAGKIKYTQEHIRTYIHLRPKTKRFSTTLRLRSVASRAIQDYFHHNEFVQVHTPIFTSNDCEGAGEVFTVRPECEKLLKEMLGESKTANPESNFNMNDVFFNKKVHLTVSSQLHLESLVGGLEKVWTFSPVFRSENNKSTRHLSEFYMIEAELAFAYNIEDVLETMENLVTSSIREVLSNHIQDWRVATQDNSECLKLLETILKHPFTVMTFEEAKNLLNSKTSENVTDSRGLSREQELLLTEKLNNGIPVFVVDWPAAIKPFYMRQCDYDPSKVSAVDLLVPSVGELCGGGLRESNLDLLERKIEQTDPSGKLKDSLNWYLDLRKYGGVPSGGFGLGFDRLLLLMTGLGNIKDVSPFPRWAHHCPM